MPRVMADVKAKPMKSKILPLLFLSVLSCFGQSYYLTNAQLGFLVVNNFIVTNVLVAPKDGTREIELPFTLTITTLTNIVWTDNSKPFKNATVRWKITNVVRRFTLESYNLNVGDEQFTFKRVADKPVSSVTNRLVFKGEWVKP